MNWQVAEDLPAVVSEGEGSGWWVVGEGAHRNGQMLGTWCLWRWYGGVVLPYRYTPQQH